MPTADEVKQLEGVSAAQHRFRLAVNAPDPSIDNGPSSASSSTHRLPPDQGSTTGSMASLPYRNSRYKEKFQSLREKYDRVIAKQQEYHQDLEIATAKIKKLQAENDLLLDAMNLAASHQPSMFGPLPPSHPPDMPPGGGPMDVADRLPPRHVNGNGNSNGTRSSSSSGPGLQTNGTAHAHEQSRPTHASRQPSIEFISHDMNGRAP
ncbi:hypothetical protein B0H14DRAFT_2873707 [Mycena olivaceomarginata]|nr:hypothetical protein B0H14DRAFT_2873707 [Mycena olivaceomarginata]